jgi:hypothetical protein
VNEIAVAFAEENPPAAVIAAAMVHVPASTNATRPVLELMVHTEVVELEYDFVPLPSPALAVEVIVGFVPTVNEYGEPEYDAASMVSVREVAEVTVISIVGEVAALYVESPPSVARIEHVPVFVASAVSVVPEILQYKRPLTTSYVVLPAVPADKVVPSEVVWPTAMVVEVAVTVTVRSVLPAVNETMLP